MQVGACRFHFELQNCRNFRFYSLMSPDTAGNRPEFVTIQPLTCSYSLLLSNLLKEKLQVALSKLSINIGTLN